MDFAALRAAFDDLAGLDLEDDERDELLNEGYVKLCTESEYRRSERELGPTVADQADYLTNDAIYRILSVEVGGYMYSPSDRSTFLSLTNGDLSLRSRGVWRKSFSGTGERQISLYPVPGSSGTSITALCVETPAYLDDDSDEPDLPRQFHRAIVDYASAVAFGSYEDNVELRDYYEDKYERAKSELRRLAFATGRAVTTWQISGWTR